jgi:hypothetical protein
MERRNSVEEVGESDGGWAVDELADHPVVEGDALFGCFDGESGVQ